MKKSAEISENKVFSVMLLQKKKKIEIKALHKKSPPDEGGWRGRTYQSV